MAKKDVHITASGSGWKVTRAGRAMSEHKTQRAAIEAGRREARRDGVELVTHGRDGRIRSKDTFVPFTSGFFKDEKTREAILERDIIEPSGQPSVSRAKIADASRKVFYKAARHGEWIARSRARVGSKRRVS